MDPKGCWTLSVGGTNLNASTQAQYIEIELSFPLRVPLARTELAGRLCLVSDAAMFTRFTENARAKALEELMAKVLAEAAGRRRPSR